MIQKQKSREVDEMSQQVNNGVRIICPTKEELIEEVKTNIKCPIETCDRILPQRSSLRLHLVKVHKIIETAEDEAIFRGKKRETAADESDLIYQYHCPVHSCKYHINKRKYFATLRSLKRHFNQRHGEKVKCDMCKCYFGPEQFRRHNCRTIFYCDTCSGNYLSIDALKYHCKKLSHPFPDKYKTQRTQKKEAEKIGKSSPSTSGQPKKKKGTGSSSLSSSVTQPLLLPKPIILPLEVKFITTPQQNFESPKVILVTQPTPRLAAPKVPRTLAPKTVIDLAPVRPMITQQSVMASSAPLPGVKKRVYGYKGLGSVIAKNLNVAQTQTSGDYILRTAIESAKIGPTKESRSSQVSPRAKIVLSNRTEQSCQTQTKNSATSVRKRKHPDSQIQSLIESCDVPKVSNAYTEVSEADPFLGVDDPQSPLNMSHNETQTMEFWEKIQSDLAATISTQTFESFLSSNPNEEDTEEEIGDFTKHSTEIQTENVEDIFDMMPLPSSDNVDNAVQVDFNSALATPSSSAQLSIATNTPISRSKSNPSTSDMAIATTSNAGLVDVGIVTLYSQLGSSQSQMDGDPGPSVHTQTSHNDLEFPDFLDTGCQTGSLYTECTNTETQTMDEMFNQFLSNMHTQTPDNNMLFNNNQTQTQGSSTETQTSADIFPDLNFADIETQTLTIQDSTNVTSQDAASAETQTNFHILPQNEETVQFTNTETQTFFPTNFDFDSSLSLTNSETQTNLNFLL